VLANEHGRYKDIKECLMAGGPVEVMRKCLESAGDFPPEKVKAAE